jgi:hypothetical protein
LVIVEPVLKVDVDDDKLVVKVVVVIVVDEVEIVEVVAIDV